MIELEGGRPGLIWRDGERVTRPTGAWTPTVHRFLRHLRDRGFAAAPMPLATDGDSEILTFVEGRVCEHLADPETGSLAMLASAATLLRAFHEASRGFLEADRETQVWMLPPREPPELICHGDFAPYNVATIGGQASGIIDFDAAHPAPAVWDLAYAIYRWAPLSDPAHEGVVFETDEQLRRARLFCDAYGLGDAERRMLPELIPLRIEALLAFMSGQAADSDQASADAVSSRDSDIYIRDLDYVGRNREPLLLALI